MNTYVSDQAWQKERDRLGRLQSMFDGYTTQRLTDLGVGEGWQCLEVGCGAGSVALWLADRVGRTGRVVVVDLDPRFLDAHGQTNLEVRRQDIRTAPLGDGSLDLVHARAVLMLIPDYRYALERMISAVRPGGWLMIEDVDCGGIMTAALARYVDPPEDAPLFERMFCEVEAAFTAVGRDVNLGSRLIGLLKDAGLENIAGEVHAPLLPSEGPHDIVPDVQQLVEVLARLELASAAGARPALTLSADRPCHCPPGFMVTAWGQRPAE
jgi:SAM-dependent methyltransferase